MRREELKDKVGDLLVDMILALEDRFDVEFDFDNAQWHEIEDTLTDHLLECEILSEEEIRENELLNHADALSDESRGR
tara:strand:+ start:416 stop:649 length:234 start_codon:yes stop_codon:yes gene_type:complete